MARRSFGGVLGLAPPEGLVFSAIREALKGACEMWIDVSRAPIVAKFVMLD